MGTMQLVSTTPNFRAELVWLLKNRADASITNARLDHWINSAYFHMCLPKVHDFRECHSSYDITLALADNDYDVSEATVGFKITGVRSVYNIMTVPETPTSRKRHLRPRDIRWFDRRTLSAGSPSSYTVEGETFYLANVPTAAEVGQLIRLRCWREPARLTADTDATILADYFDEVLCLGALWRAEWNLGYRDRAEETKQEYVDLLNEAPESGEMEGENWDYQVDINPNQQDSMVLL